MMNLISFETPPLGRKETAATTTATIKPKAASSSSTCFHGSHLDLSLGISLSHGGSGGDGSCDAAGCGGGKASYRGSRGGGDVGSASSDCMNANATANTLGAGHGSCHGIVSSGSWTTAFMPSLTGFMHPWSLAARQQKAAAEQDRSLATAPAATYVPSDARIVPLPAVAVGWPPVHTSRRNLVAAVPRSDAVARLDRPQRAKIAAVEEKNVAVPTSRMVTEARRWPANMFAKVHMDGCSIGRKINLRAHRSYESLSRALTKMTKNFFCPANYSSSSSGEDDCANIDDFIFLYEDFEGDRMLVGDVPWELFLASAKRLYIAQSPATGDHTGPDEAAKRDATEEATNN